MKQVFNLLLAQDKQEEVTDWVLLCLENFVHQYVGFTFCSIDNFFAYCSTESQSLGLYGAQPVS